MHVENVELEVAGMEMQMLYDSDAFVVVRTSIAKPDIVLYEIARKEDLTVSTLCGFMADAFAAQVIRWQENVPEKAEVEALLDSYSQLASAPLRAH